MGRGGERRGGAIDVQLDRGEEEEEERGEREEEEED